MNSVNDMLSMFNDHGFTDTALSTKLSFLNDTISDFCSREPWPFLETTTELMFDGVNPTPTNHPTNLRAPKVIVGTSNNGLVVTPERVETLEKSQLEIVTDKGEPLFYYFVGSELRFAPIPPSSYTARMTYLRFHPEVDEASTSDDILIPTRLWMILVFGTLVKLYDMEDDPELAVRFEQHYEVRIQQAKDEIFRRQLDRPDRIVITDPDLYDYDM